MEKENKNFCILPWIHIATKPHGLTTLCCISEFSELFAPNNKIKKENENLNIFTSSFKQILNSNNRVSIRSTMNSSKRPAECSVCFKTEDRGGVSKRQLENKRWGITNPVVQVKYLDLRFSSACNLKCVTCAPSESSFWKEDAKKISKMTKNSELQNRFFISENDSGKEHKDNKFWDELESSLDDLEEIYFAGGEPLIQPGHFKCLDLIIDRGLAHKIKLCYNTNATRIDKKIIGKWSFFKEVQVNVSIDAVGPKNDYIRAPSKWQSLEKNLELLDSTGDNIKIRMTVTIFALNIFYLEEIINWKKERNFRKIQIDHGVSDFDINILHFPLHLNVQMFENSTKIKLKEKLFRIFDSSDVSTIFKDKIKNLIKFMDENEISSKQGMDTFKEYIFYLDQIRPVKAQDIFPFLNIVFQSEMNSKQWI